MTGITNRELDRLSVPWSQIKQLVYKGRRGWVHCAHVPETADLSACGALEHLDLGSCSSGRGLPGAAAASRSTLTSLRLQTLNSADLAAIAGCTALEQIHLEGAARLGDLMAVCGGLTSLRDLSLRYCDANDLQPPDALNRLTRLALGSFSEASLRRLASLPSLISLDISGKLEDLGPLTTLSGLQHLKLGCCHNLLHNLSPLSSCSALRHLELQDCRCLSSIAPLAACSTLEYLDMGNAWGIRDSMTDFSALHNLPQLQYLGLHGHYGLSSLDQLSALLTLKTLALKSCRGIRELSSLSSLTALRRLELRDCPAAESLNALSSLTTLTCLVLQGRGKEWSLAPLASLSGLLRLHLYGVATDLCSLSHLTRLRHLGLSPPLPSFDHHLDLQPLSSCISLEHLWLGLCRSSADLSPIAKCRELRRVHLAGVEDGRKLMKPLEGMPDLSVAVDPGSNSHVMLHMWDARRGEWEKFAWVSLSESQLWNPT